MCITLLYLRGRSDEVVRHDVLGDVSDGAKGILHQVGCQVNPALDHGRDLVDDSPPGFLDELLKLAPKYVYADMSALATNRPETKRKES